MFLAMQATQPANAASTTVTFEANDGSYVVVDVCDGGSVEAPTVALTGGGTKSLKIGHYGQYSGVTFEDLSGYEMLSSADMTVTAKIYSDAIGTPFLLKIEGATSLEKAYVATAIGWQDATWDFSTGLPNYWNGSASVPQVVNHATNYKKATLFPNFGSIGGGPYFLDNVTFNKTVTCDISSPAVLASMESNDTSGITPVGFGGTTGEITTAPEGGSYGNQKALKIVKGWETWAGITVLENFCFNYGVGGSATANVYAPAAGLPMMLKLEGPNTGWDGDDVERTATTWRAGWQQLKWDLTGVTGNHSKVALFPNFNVADNGRVFFLDDLAFNGATSPMWGNNLMNIPQPPSSLENPGKYIHVRLQKTFIGSSFDASYWDGIREYRDADTKAYVKYLSARSTFSLTYKVTDANGAPMANTPVELIVNANYSCSKATFTYGAAVIGRDDCGGKGETRLPKKNTDGNGDVTFVLTNTNLKGEAMPSSLSSPPTVGVANEIASNIQPYVADKQGFDMLLVHFVEPTGGVTLSGAATAAMTVDTKTPVTFNLKDAKGKAIAGVDVKFVADGVGTVGRTATTDADGNVSTWVNNYTDAAGVQTVSATYVGSNGFAATTSTVIQWSSTKPVATVTGGKGSVTVSIANGAGKTARISVAGSATVSRKLSSNSAVVKVKASAGTKVVTVTIDGVATKVVVQVAR
jgi:hypothetical protein